MEKGKSVEIWKAAVVTLTHFRQKATLDSGSFWAEVANFTSFQMPSTLFRWEIKVKFTLEQTMKAQRGGRGIALLFL